MGGMEDRDREDLARERTERDAALVPTLRERVTWLENALDDRAGEARRLQREIDARNATEAQAAVQQPGAGMVFHRFRYQVESERWVCTLPDDGPREGWCLGCGVYVTQETVARWGFVDVGPGEDGQNLLLSTMVALGLGRLPGVECRTLVATSESFTSGAFIYDVPETADENEQACYRFVAETVALRLEARQLRTKLDDAIDKLLAVTRRAEAAEADLAGAAQLVLPPGLADWQRQRIKALEDVLRDVLTQHWMDTHPGRACKQSDHVSLDRWQHWHEVLGRAHLLDDLVAPDDDDDLDQFIAKPAQHVRVTCGTEGCTEQGTEYDVPLPLAMGVVVGQPNDGYHAVPLVVVPDLRCVACNAEPRIVAREKVAGG